MYNAVGGSTIIFAGAWPRAAAVRLPRPLARRRRRRLADRLLRAAALLLPDRPPVRRVRPAAATRPTRRTPRTRRCRRCPIGAAGLKIARAHTKLGWHWWPEFNSINSAPYDGRRAVRPAEHLPVGLQRGRQGVDRPDPLAQGDRPRRAARDRRPRPPDRDRRARPRDRRDLDRPRRRRALRAGEGRRRSPPTPSARRGCCCSRRRPRHPDGLANSSGLVGKRLMMHPFANVAGLFDEPLDELAGPVRRPHRVARVLRDRREARLRPRRPLGPGAHRRADQHGAPQPRRRAGLGPRPPPPRQDPPRPRRELGPVRRGPARRGEPRHAVVDGDRLVRASRRPRSTTGWPTTRAGCSTSTSSGRRSRWTRPAPTRSRSTG